MDKSLHVFVCTTYRDLVSERKAVLDGLEALRVQFPTLTFFCPRSIQPLEACKEEIQRSDVLVLMLGHLNGVVAPGLDMVHGEAEYAQGMALGKKILVYFRDENVGLYPAHFERDANRSAQLKAFKDKVGKAHAVKIFGDLYSLVGHINQDLSTLALEKGLDARPASKATRFKGKPWETRRLPLIKGNTPATETSEEHQTRTIPVLQRALSMPFERRKSASIGMGKTITVVLVLVAAVGFALTRIHKLPFDHASTKAHHRSLNGAEPAAAGEEQANGTAGGSALNDQGGSGIGQAGESVNPEAETPANNVVSATEITPPKAPAQGTARKAAGAKPAPKKSAGTVVLMDDTDSNKVFLSKAALGSPEEQFQAGQMYEEGRGAPRSDSIALRWYRKAAERGLVDAQYQVALMYRTGKGTKKSAYQAARWFQAAAEQGNSKAQVKLGQMYQVGKGVPRNETAAFKWFLKAADQKDPDAEKILAQMKESD